MQPATNLNDDKQEPKSPDIINESVQKSFYEALENDLVDNRGKQGQKHYLAFVLFGFIIAILHKKQKKASIQRFMVNKHPLLCKLTGHWSEKAVSQAQLGRILSTVDWECLNAINEKHLGLTILTEINSKKEAIWLSGDGKDLKGGVQVNASHTSSVRGEVSIRLVEQESKRVVAQSFYDGDKESEKTHMRALMQKQKLSHRSITLDAIHCDPKTTELIALNEGIYLIPAKDNQEYLVKDLISEARRQREDKRFVQIITHDKGHGRIEKREYTLFDVSKQNFDSRWHTSNIRSLITVYRQREMMSKNSIIKKEEHTAYFISNTCAKELKKDTLTQLSKAIRGRWSIETDNYIRDVTLGEDDIKTQKGNRTRSEATLRTIALEWLKCEKPKNFNALLDNFADSELFLTNFLIKYRFISINAT
jgi:predicted transposase YbfD/YdcC